MNFQADVTLHSPGRPSLVSLDNESQVDDDDDDDCDEDEKDDFDDDKSLNTASSADRSVCDDTWIDGTSAPAWHRMLYALNKV